MATVSYEIGYWLAVIALAGGAAFSFYLQSQQKKPEDEETVSETLEPDTTLPVEGLTEGDRPSGA